MRQSTRSLTLMCLLLAGGSTLARAQDVRPGGSSLHGSNLPGILQVASVTEALRAGALTMVVINQESVGNRVQEQSVGQRSIIDNSFRENLGIVDVNQASGNFNNQLNVRALVLFSGAADAAAVAQSLVTVGAARLTDNTVLAAGDREVRLDRSLTGTSGILGVNQAAGNLNVQGNLLALAVGSGSVPDFSLLADNTLGAVNSGNTLVPADDARLTATITGSFAGYRGIAQVTQAAGDLNIVRNILTFSYTVVGP